MTVLHFLHPTISAGQTVDVISESFLELIDKVDEVYGDGAKIYAPEVQYTNGAWEFGEAPLVGTVSRIICCFLLKICDLC